MLTMLSRKQRLDTLPPEIICMIFRGHMNKGRIICKKIYQIVGSGNWTFQVSGGCLRPRMCLCCCSIKELSNLMDKFPYSTIGVSSKQYRQLGEKQRKHAKVVITAQDVARILPEIDDELTDSMLGDTLYMQDILRLTIDLTKQCILPSSKAVSEFYHRVCFDHEFLTSTEWDMTLPLTDLISRFLEHPHLHDTYLLPLLDIWIEAAETIQFTRPEIVCEKLMKPAMTALRPQVAFSVTEKFWKKMESLEYPRCFIKILTEKIPEWASSTSGVNAIDVHNFLFDVVDTCLANASVGNFDLLQGGVLEVISQLAVNATVPRKTRKVY